MKKYQGMSIEEIKKDKTIPEEDRYRMLKLLKLGLSYPQISAQNVGKASFDSIVEECDNAQQVMSRLKEEKEKTTNKI